MDIFSLKRELCPVRVSCTSYFSRPQTKLGSKATKNSTKGMPKAPLAHFLRKTSRLSKEILSQLLPRACSIIKLNRIYNGVDPPIFCEDISRNKIYIFLPTLYSVKRQESIVNQRIIMNISKVNFQFTNHKTFIYHSDGNGW